MRRLPTRRRGPTRWERVGASVDAAVPIAFKPAAILAGEIALSHRTRPSGAHHPPSRRRSQAIRPSPCPVRHRRLAVSGPLASELASQPPSAGLPIPRGYSRVHPKIRIVPVNAVGSARSATPACAWTAIEATRGQSSGCCSQPTAAAGRRTTGRDRGGMRTGAPSRRGTLRPITAALTQFRAPSMRFPQPRWCTRIPLGRPPGTLWPERRYRSELPSRTPSD